MVPHIRTLGDIPERTFHDHDVVDRDISAWSVSRGPISHHTFMTDLLLRRAERLPLLADEYACLYHFNIRQIAGLVSVHREEEKSILWLDHQSLVFERRPFARGLCLHPPEFGPCTIGLADLIGGVSLQPFIVCFSHICAALV